MATIRAAAPSTATRVTVGRAASQRAPLAARVATSVQVNRGVSISSPSTRALSIARPAAARQFSVMAATQDELKKQTAWKAVEYIKSGMKVGLGTGSTAAFAVARIGELLASGELKDIVAVPTSEATRAQAESLGIPLATLDTVPNLDVAIDGADEVDPDLNLVKGRGGALLREKMVEQQSTTFVCIIDDSKLVDALGGSKLAMPVEITKFCHEFSLQRLQALPEVAGCEARLRMDGDDIYVTDNDNYIVDLYFENEPIKDAVAAGKAIAACCGVVEHGLFLGMADVCIIAGKDGVTTQEKKK